MNENQYYRSSSSSVEGRARYGGPPSLRRRWMHRWAAQNRILARALWDNIELWDRDAAAWEMYENFVMLIPGVTDLDDALFQWGQGKRPPIEEYRRYGIEQLAEPEAFYDL